MANKLWQLAPPVKKQPFYPNNYGLPSIILDILAKRGISESEIENFLYGSLNDLYDPFLLPDMGKAVARIKQAIQRKEKIAAYGDYDVDGITSLAIFGTYLKQNNAECRYYIPHRIEEGYGLNKKAIESLLKEGASLIVCFDCGTTAKEEIQFAAEKGVDVIVVDHHQPGKVNLAEIPHHSLINPKRPDASYPFKDLSSGALSFKLVEALGKEEAYEFLDLTALSLVCDVVPLVGENRILVKEGLRAIRQSKNLGVRALAEVAKIKLSNINVFHLGFILGPRINATGRISSAHSSLELLLAEDYDQAKDIALQLHKQNQTRKSYEAEVLREALFQVESTADFSRDYALIAYREGWHPGVLGIVASRIVERYYRPAFVLSLEGNIAKGSVRSIHNISIIEVLSKCSENLISYGGHHKAAGIELKASQIDDFKKKLNSYLENLLDKKEMAPLINIDAEIKFSDITPDLISGLERLKPFGEGNREPLFLTQNTRLKNSHRPSRRSQTSVWLTDGNRVFEARFYQKDGFDSLFSAANALDIVYSLGYDSYNDAIFLKVKDARISSFSNAASAGIK